MDPKLYVKVHNLLNHLIKLAKYGFVVIFKKYIIYKYRGNWTKSFSLCQKIVSFDPLPNPLMLPLKLSSPLSILT